jgi:hypothetical protein
MEETGVLENLSLLSYVLPDFDPSPVSEGAYLRKPSEQMGYDRRKNE